jgi:hypothetical protein
MAKIAIITRMAFDKDLTKNQTLLFEEYLIRLNSQTYKGFEVFILADSVRAFKGSAKNKQFLEMQCSRLPFVHVKDPERFKYDIEIRLDFDDVVSPGFIQDVLNQYTQSKHDNLIISYQPVMVDNETGEQWKHPSQYSKDCPSMCMALCQKGDKARGVYDRPHNLMYNETKWPVIVRPEGFFYLTVHEENALSTLPTDPKMRIIR